MAGLRTERSGSWLLVRRQVSRASSLSVVGIGFCLRGFNSPLCGHRTRLVRFSLPNSRLTGLYNLYAGITLQNESSVGLHRSCGFHQIGLERSVGFKLGAWHDVSIWHLPLRPCLPAPEPPTPLATVVERDSWAGAISAGLQFIRL